MLKLQDGWRVSQRRAARVPGAHRSGIRYRPKRPLLDAPIRKRIEEIAAVRVRYGYRRIHVLLQREGWHINSKRVYRSYCLAGLNLRSKRPKRRRMASHRASRPDVTQANNCWTFAFFSDALINGKRLHALTVMDPFTRECLAIRADQHIKGDQVVALVSSLCACCGYPKRLHDLPLGSQSARANGEWLRIG